MKSRCQLCERSVNERQLEPLHIGLAVPDGGVECIAHPIACARCVSQIRVAGASERSAYDAAS